MNTEIGQMDIGRLLLIAVFTTLLLWSCSSEDAANEGYVYQVPEALGDGWSVSDLTSESLNQPRLESMMEQIALKNYGVFLKNILIIKNGHLVFEEYFGQHGNNKVHLQSATKSIVSAIFGIAYDKGVTGPVENPVFSYFPEYSNLHDNDKESISVEHVLTMTPGFEWNETSSETFGQQNDNIAAYLSNNYIRYVLGKDVVEPPGSRWEYNSGCPMILAGIVKKTTGLHIDQYGRQHLFEPLQIQDVRWEYEAGGLPLATGGLWMRPRDIAKIGELFLKGGEFNGERVLSQDWVSASLTEHTPVNDQWDYGYQWWTGIVANKKIWFASGYGGQLVIIVPSKQAVIVINGEYSTNAELVGQTESKIWELLRAYILTSI